ncbi:MAG: preprotein translocase subunit SecY [Deltaproteobacteria bacterium]|nr:preprotein translocase subunit SecY [Deltaproteobacteria bacterium]
MIEALQNVFRIEELRRRIFFTAAMLAVYRVGCIVVTPGINGDVIRQFFMSMEGTMFGLLNVFSGGAMEQLSIFALGIMPYISASIIFQLLTVVIPALERLKKEGSEGQKRITQWTRYATIALALFQSFLMSIALENGQFGQGAVLEPGWGFRLTTMITLTAGTAFIMWLGEQVTERGIGNGISLIIFSGIVVGLPSGVSNVFDLVRTGEFEILNVIFLGAVVVAAIAFVVFVERGQRRIPIQHARRGGNTGQAANMSYFPLRVNTAGVIPPIFASSLLMLPLTVRQYTDNPTVQRFIDEWMNPGALSYNVVYVALIIFFCFFYTSIMINPDDVSENIKRSGGYIPGVRPGRKTADYIDAVLSRLTLVGAVYVAAICVLPVILSQEMGVPFYFGGTALLIAVSVSLDTVGQIEAHLVSRRYEGFSGTGRVRGRLGR